MKKVIILSIVSLTLFSCPLQRSKDHKKTTTNTNSLPTKMTKKTIDENLPTIGILIFEGVIINEVVAPLDVFSTSNKEGKQQFNVITIAKENKVYTSAHGLKVKPDVTLNNVPQLKVLVIPSSYSPTDQTSDKALVEFVKQQNQSTEYIASHCAGAFLIGESGIAYNKEIVTYVTGGESLKASYPNLIVADDSTVSVVEDGKFISSNGSLVSYLASFHLLEKLTNKAHRKFVEEAILFHRLNNK